VFLILINEQRLYIIRVYVCVQYHVVVTGGRRNHRFAVPVATAADGGARRRRCRAACGAGEERAL